MQLTLNLNLSHNAWAVVCFCFLPLQEALSSLLVQVKATASLTILLRISVSAKLSKLYRFSKQLIESFVHFPLDMIGQAVAPAAVLMQTQVGRMRGLPGHQSSRIGSAPRAQLISSHIAKSAVLRGRQHCGSVYSSATSTKEPSLEVRAAAFVMHLVPATGCQRRCVVLCGCQRCCLLLP